MPVLTQKRQEQLTHTWVIRSAENFVDELIKTDTQNEYVLWEREERVTFREHDAYVWLHRIPAKHRIRLHYVDGVLDLIYVDGHGSFRTGGRSFYELAEFINELK